jgi:hypothetical protein
MTDTADPVFIDLIASFHAAAMVQLGKVINPASGTVERNLDFARHTIDVLDMPQTKCAGNLTDPERRFLEHVLFELRLNYIDEEGRSDTVPPASEGSQPASDQANPPPDEG